MPLNSNKVIPVDDAARLVHDGDTLTTSGFVGIGVPDELLAGLERRFLDSGEPRGLSLLFAAGQGDGSSRGLNRLAHDGLLRRAIGGHWGLIPKVSALALDGKIEAYNLPQGTISHLYRDIAAGKPGLLSKVGLGTFVDPRQGGGKINSVTTEDLVELIEVRHEQYLFYQTMPLNIAFLRGTTADELGNVTMEREALVLDNLAQAMATRNSGGIVIVQVERIAAKHSLCARDVIIPGALVDAIVVSTPENHQQTYATSYSHAFSGQFRQPARSTEPTPLSARKVIARRCAMELPVNGIINLGIGMPEGVAEVAGEEGLLEHLTLTAEPGVIGGQPASGMDFGAAVNTDSVIAQNQQFDLYDGGGLDLACLGMAEADAQGNVNVSRFGSRLTGAGGFINISQNAKRVVFAGTFTAGGLSVEVVSGEVVIKQEGRARKFLSQVEQITFAGLQAAQASKPVLFVTERCVFDLNDQGMVLTEIAPGIDVENDILANMGFKPHIGDLVEMDPRLFQPSRMGIEIDLLHLDLDDRIAIDPDLRILFVNFEKMRIQSQHDITMIEKRVESLCRSLDYRVDVVVNYDGTRIAEDIERDFVAMVKNLEQRFYSQVSRYSSSAFMRMKLGNAFADRASPHIFESAREARLALEAERRSRFKA